MPLVEAFEELADHADEDALDAGVQEHETR